MQAQIGLSLSVWNFRVSQDWFSVVSACKFNLVQMVVFKQDLINTAVRHCPQLQNTLVSEETQVSGLL